LAYSKNSEFCEPSYIPLARGGRDDLVDSLIISTDIEFDAWQEGKWYAHPNW
jgi:hypothetical protein